ncbi:GNAT family N-acetyltransferase [Nocardioides aromaticivorans]|uniref:GNAT family N-acetyltransferase n=1 Tax=Nocardioides aromaticivorans TaxID=200618 RepID=A0ABX7PLV3_9ACTN|nr:bifunctional GNAT family N-acetyltransferase/acetate--CoA ligase family protein [Nocardioides aromaticivorans]QSR26974.1 GNAT family N-acetyltransferase [Nocardioides aromaticivorans]
MSPRPADVLLSDGSVAVVRPVAPGDGPALHDLHASVCDDSIFLRFFGTGRRAAHAYVEHVLASPETLSLVACEGDRLVGLATAEPTATDTYEVAFLVADDRRGHGVGTLLLEHLADLARSRGATGFTAEVLADNHRMLEVFTGAGFEVVRTGGGGECQVHLDIVDGSRAQAAADLREFAAERRSLRPLLAPRSVAVYGARRDGSGIGGAVLAAIRRDGFAGQVVVVRPDGAPVGDLPARRRLEDGPPVDLAVLAVPVERVRAALEDAIAGGAGAAVVVSSGFGEMGPEGVVLQQEIGRLARRNGVRLVGPNCLGVLDNAPDVRLNATFGLAAPSSGGLALASQSGGVGIALVDLLGRAGVGLHTFVSLGNKVDVSGNDLLAAWYDDPDITCAALYLESFGNARKFLRFARAFGERKPVVAVVGGRSAGGQRAGASHTAASATPALGVEALFAQAGVIACQDAEELAETVTVLVGEPLPQGRRLAVVSNAGGLGVLATDAADDAGLDVVAFSPALQGELAGRVSRTTGWANPVDAGAGVDAAGLAGIAHTVLASGEVDALLVVLVATDTNDVAAALDELAAIRSAHPGRPLVVVPVGAEEAGREARTSGALTVMGSGRAAAAALGRAAAYAEWRRRPRDPMSPGDPARAHLAREEAAALLRDAGPDGWIGPAAASRMLDRFGVRLLGEVVPADRAAGTAARIGFPAAVKAAGADIVHRTERGLVATGLGNRDEVAAAVAGFGTARTAPVLVQPMVAGVEIALGVVRDATLGPLVMIADGGVATELSDDRILLVPPFSVGEAMVALRRMRLWPRLAGFRGAPPAAAGDLAATAVALGTLAVEVPEVAELDLNPVVVGPDGVAVVDLKLRLAHGVPVDQPRQLRPS